MMAPLPPGNLKTRQKLGKKSLFSTLKMKVLEDKVNYIGDLDIDVSQCGQFKQFTYCSRTSLRRPRRLAS